MLGGPPHPTGCGDGNSQQISGLPSTGVSIPSDPTSNGVRAVGWWGPALPTPMVSPTRAPPGQYPGGRRRAAYCPGQLHHRCQQGTAPGGCSGRSLPHLQAKCAGGETSTAPPGPRSPHPVVQSTHSTQLAAQSCPCFGEQQEHQHCPRHATGPRYSRRPRPCSSGRAAEAQSW